MDFEEMMIKLKRYSFESKMKFCFEKSINILDFVLNIDSKYKSTDLYPWEVEVFTLMSLMSYKEYNNQEFSGKFARNSMNCIRNYHCDTLNKKEDIVRNIFILIISSQFQIQENYTYKIYRYNYFFNFQNDKINMKEMFQVKFKTSYDEFLIFCEAIICLMEVGLSYECMIRLINKYSEVIKNFIISREQYINDQKQITPNLEDYYYGYKCFYAKPFIKYDEKVYFPLPHLLIDNITISLLYELTEGDNYFRSIFGKEVFENYLFDILNNEKIYTKVLKEQEYFFQGNKKHTSDVLINNEEYVVLFDCKMFEPKNSIRKLDEKEINKNIEIVSKSIIQMYKSINKSFLNEYNPFSNKEIKRDNIFGIIVPLSKNKISKRYLMSKVKELLIENGINKVDEEVKYIESNIYIFDIYEIERIAFKEENIIDILIKMKQEEKYNDITFEIPETEKININLKKFTEQLIHKTEKVLYDILHDEYNK